MGLLFTALAKLNKSSLISVIDLNNNRLKIANSLGANNLFQIKKNNKKVVNIYFDD